MNDSRSSTSRGPPPHAPATPAVRRRRPTIVSTPNAIAMIVASGDEYSDEEENIDEVALDLSSGRSEASHSEPDTESSEASSPPPSPPPPCPPPPLTTRVAQRARRNILPVLSHTRPQQPACTWTDGDDFIPNVYDFDHTSSGISDASGITDDSTILDFFKLFVDDAVMDLIVHETNRYFVYCGGFTNLSPFSRARRWKDTTSQELHIFLALTLLMPLVKKHAIRDYWKKDSMTFLPVFPRYMSRDRYQLLLGFLHFADNTTQDKNDSLCKIRELFTMMNANFTKYFTPFQRLVIDESLVLFRGRISFRQYIKTKAHRFGIKLFVLCDCETGVVKTYFILFLWI